MEDAGIKFLLSKHENAAGFMAEGVHHITKAPGLLIATVGPGAANAVNVTVNALQDRVPLIVITGCVDPADSVTYNHQVFDHCSVFSPITKASFRVSDGFVEELIDKAIAIATEGRPGPVHLDLPIKIANQVHPVNKIPTRATPAPIKPANGEALKKARQWLLEAQNPLMIVGLDAVHQNASGPIIDFCKKFGVDYAVSGSIRTSGKRVRISVELSDSSDGKALWNNKYDRILEDIFDVQDEIVRKISIALLGEIEISSLERANRKPTENLTSYELLLRGKVLHHKFKREACLEAIDSFNKAIQADNKNGQAYAWKACAIGQGMGRGYLEGDMKEWWDNSMQCIEKAQQLNDNDFEVHRMLAEVALSTHDFKAGERHARTSFKMVPNDPRVLSVYGEILSRTGSTEKGIELLESALELDPIPMGKTNTDHRTGAVLFGYFMDRNSDKCKELIKNLQEVDFKSWLVTAKICDDEEIEYTSEVWFTENKDHFKEIDWEMEIDRFHLNNEGLQKSLVGFVESLFN
mgnify:CR=1 FL=1